MKAEDIVDAHDDLDLIEKMASNRAGGEYDFGLDDVVGTDASLDGVSPTTLTDSGFSAAPDSTPTTNTSKKRKQRDALEGLVEVIGKMHEATNTRLEYLATRIGYEFDLAKARKDVFELVGSINGLNLAQVFDASEFILAKVERMDFFMSLPHAAKHAYVYRALEKYSGQ
ncbi:uncharacterized protein LOC125207963 [Salvia hispanica]|uniref:uncharacterized protein LOC125207963 n=1 Tax=Salvia hispanica TaxID=49212 RepID=UPI0020090205|nr:uncharacterized protein LOC125207963 [Salvia hispanica]